MEIGLAIKEADLFNQAWWFLRNTLEKGYLKEYDKGDKKYLMAQNV